MIATMSITYECSNLFIIQVYISSYDEDSSSYCYYRRCRCRLYIVNTGATTLKLPTSLSRVCQILASRDLVTK